MKNELKIKKTKKLKNELQSLKNENNRLWKEINQRKENNISDEGYSCSIEQLEADKSVIVEQIDNLYDEINILENELWEEGITV